MKTFKFFVSFAVLLTIAVSCTDVAPHLNRLEKTWRNYEINCDKLEQHMTLTTEPASGAPYFSELYPGCEFYFSGPDTIAIFEGRVVNYWNESVRIKYSFVDGEDINQGLIDGYGFDSRPHDAVFITARKGWKENFTILDRIVGIGFEDCLSEKDLNKPWSDVKKQVMAGWCVQVGPFHQRHHLQRTLLDDGYDEYSFEMEDFHEIHIKRLYTILKNISSKKEESPSLLELRSGSQK